MGKFRKVALLVAAATVLYVGNVFAGGNAEKSGATASAGQQITLSYTWWGADPSRDKKYNDIADAFQKAYPNIKISRQIASWNDYWTKLTTQVAGGNAPDVMGMHQTKVSGFVRRGALLDLDPYVNDKTINLGDFPKSVIDAGTLNNKIFMVAQGVTMTGILYDSSLLKKLGIQAPTNSWTWQDYADLSIKASQAFKRLGMQGWGSTDLSSDLTSLIIWARENGKEVFNADGSLGLNEQDMIDWFTYWDKLRKAGGIPDAATNVQYRGLGVEQSMLVKGLVAFAAVPFNQMPNYQRYITGEVGAVLRPQLQGGKPGQFVEGSYLAIATTSKYPKQAAEFINFFVNSPVATKIFKLEQGAMGSTKMNEVVKPLLDPIQVREIDAIEAGLKVASTIPIPPAGENQVENSALQNAADAVAFGKLSIPAAAKQFVEQATKILSQAQ